MRSGMRPVSEALDELSELGQHDLAAYFRERQRLLDAVIDACPSKREAMRSLQEEIDRIRATSGSPAVAMQQIVSMMIEKVRAMDDYATGCKAESSDLAATGMPEGPTGRK